MVFVDVKHPVYLHCSVHEDKRRGQLAGESVAATDTVIEHLSPFVQDMRTRGVANLQVSGDAATGNLSPFVQYTRTGGLRFTQTSRVYSELDSLCVSQGGRPGPPVARVSVDVKQHWRRSREYTVCV